MFIKEHLEIYFYISVFRKNSSKLPVHIDLQAKCNPYVYLKWLVKKRIEPFIYNIYKKNCFFNTDSSRLSGELETSSVVVVPDNKFKHYVNLRIST
jgi:hypothetical protein